MEIEITGLEYLMRLLGVAASNEMLRAPMVASLALLHGRLATYPTPLTNSSYRRTGTLGRSWTTAISAISDGIRGEVGNNVGYAPYVQGGAATEPNQAWMHAGRWQTDVQVMQQSEAQIRALFEDAVRRAIR